MHSRKKLQVLQLPVTWILVTGGTYRGNAPSGTVTLGPNPRRPAASTGRNSRTGASPPARRTADVTVGA